MIKLTITKSKLKDKKFKAVFTEQNKVIKTTQFGAKGMSDYTIHKDLKRRTLYRNRHKKDLKTNDPMRAGFLSYFLLWGDSTDFKKNLKKYKNKYNFV